MPDRTKLQIGDSIRMINVPEFDREESETGMLSTATVLKHLIEKKRVVVIDQIDEYQQAWFSVRIEIGEDMVHHSLAIMEDESWEIVYQVSSGKKMPKEHQIAVLKKHIDETLTVYEEEYEALAEASEKLYDQRDALNKKYQALDRKSGLNALFKKLGELCEEPPKK